MRGDCYQVSNDRRTQDRRRRRLSFVLCERRSGFDRRADSRGGTSAVGLEGLLRGLRDRPRRVTLILVAVNVLNLADFLLTLNVLAMGGGEANPLMRSLFAAHPLYAGTFKMLAVFAVSLVIWRCRRFRSALQAALIVLAVFSLVFIYHILGLTLLG